MLVPKYGTMLDSALEMAHASLAEGGIPSGAAVFAGDGALLGRGMNRSLQTGRMCAHAEIEALGDCGSREDWDGCVLVCTHAPCLMCAGMAAQFGFATVVVGSMEEDHGCSWLLRDMMVSLVNLRDERCSRLETEFRKVRSREWDADRGE